MLAGYVLVFVFNCIAFGAFMAVTDGHALTLAHILDRGWFFAAFMTVLNAVLFARRRIRP